MQRGGERLRSSCPSAPARACEVATSSHASCQESKRPLAAPRSRLHAVCAAPLLRGLPPEAKQLSVDALEGTCSAASVSASSKRASREYEGSSMGAPPRCVELTLHSPPLLERCTKTACGHLQGVGARPARRGKSEQVAPTPPFPPPRSSRHARSCVVRGVKTLAGARTAARQRRCEGLVVQLALRVMFAAASKPRAACRVGHQAAL